MIEKLKEFWEGLRVWIKTSPVEAIVLAMLSALVGVLLFALFT